MVEQTAFTTEGTGRTEDTGKEKAMIEVQHVEYDPQRQVLVYVCPEGFANDEQRKATREALAKPMEPGSALALERMRLQAVITLPPKDEEPVPSDGAAMIAAERRRQVIDEGWTAELDGQWVMGELGQAAECYLSGKRDLWPWAPGWWKPKDRLSNLVRAGALIAAEIDRLQAETQDA